MDLEKFTTLSREEKISTYDSLKKVITEAALRTFMFDFHSMSSDYSGREVHVDSTVTQEDIQWLYTHFNRNNYIAPEEISVFKKIMANLAQIHSSLVRIEKVFDIDYEIGLVGGALRDLFNGKHSEIKDLDIVFSLKNIRGFSHPLLRHENANSMVYPRQISEEELKKMSPEELSELEAEEKVFNLATVWPNLSFITAELDIPFFNFDEKTGTSRVEQFFFHLVKSVLEREFKIEKDYPPRALPDDLKNQAKAKAEVWRSGYHNALLRGVVKLNDPKLTYPADILLCNDSVAAYVGTFDFDFCKISLEFENKETKKLDNLLNFFKGEHLLDMYHAVKFPRGFVQDMKNKTFTINPLGFDLNAVEEALMKHYPRLKEKYPDHQIKFIDNSTIQKNLKPEISDYIKKFQAYEKMNQAVPDKKESKEMKKESRKKI